jgi:hypothetical protein
VHFGDVGAHELSLVDALQRLDEPLGRSEKLRSL